MSSNEVTLYTHGNPVDTIDRLGNWFTKSGMFGCDRPEQGQVLAAICISERKSPTELLRTYDIVEGKLRKKGMAALAEFRGKGGVVRWTRTGDETTHVVNGKAVVLDGADRYAEGIFEFEGLVTTYRYSMADALAEGLIRKGSRWEKRPGNMLRARVTSNVLGMIAPEIFAGEDDAEPSVATPIALAVPAAPSPAAKSDALPAPQNVSQPTPATTTATPTASPTASHVIDVTATVESQKIAPQVEAAARAADAMSGTVGSDTAPRTTLDDATVSKLEAAMGEHGAVCCAFLLAKGKMVRGAGLETVNADYAAKILSNPGSFIKFAIAAAGGAK